MTGLGVLAILGVVGSCYATIGALVAIAGDKRLPEFVKPLLEPTSHVSTSRIGRVGSTVVALIWMAFAVVPQGLLVREVVLGRASPTETALIGLGLAGALAWACFMGWRYRRA